MLFNSSTLAFHKKRNWMKSQSIDLPLAWNSVHEFNSSYSELCTCVIVLYSMHLHASYATKTYQPYFSSHPCHYGNCSMFESRMEAVPSPKLNPQLTASWDSAMSRRDKVSQTCTCITCSFISSNMFHGFSGLFLWLLGLSII